MELPMVSYKKVGLSALLMGLCGAVAGFSGSAAVAFADDAVCGDYDKGAPSSDESNEGNAPTAEPETGADLNMLRSPDAAPVNEGDTPKEGEDEDRSNVREEPVRIDGEEVKSDEPSNVVDVSPKPDEPKAEDDDANDDAPKAEPQPLEE
jgi:hypothetical protein